MKSIQNAGATTRIQRNACDEMMERHGAQESPDFTPQSLAVSLFPLDAAPVFCSPFSLGGALLCCGAVRPSLCTVKLSINACVYAHSTVPSVNLCCTVKLLCETKQAIPCYCEIHTLYQCFLLRCCWMQSCIFLLTRLKEKLLPLCWHLVMCISLMWSKWGLQQREKNVFLLKFFFILKFFSLASTRRLLLFIFCEIFLCTFSQMEYF